MTKPDFAQLSDVVGPFGNPDGSRADLDEVLSEFVDFDGNPAYGALATRASDAKVRVIVGKLGSGKTVYMRRLQAFQARQESVYADVPRQSLPTTELVIRTCQWFSNSVLTEKWMELWRVAILRSLASHVLMNKELRHNLTTEEADDLRRDYGKLLDGMRRPRSIYSQLRDVLNAHHTAQQLNVTLKDTAWDDLEDALSDTVAHCPPIFFYLDAIDEEFAHAPMYWLRCQEGLFHEVMRLLRDHSMGGRLHVVVCLRDIVMSSIYRSEHAPRYIDEPHIRVLSWDRTSLTYLLDEKVARLSPSFLIRRPEGAPTVRDWLGLDEVHVDGVDEPIVDYLLRHTRHIPRDLVSLGNALSEEILRHKNAGDEQLPSESLFRVVSRCAKRFGDSQLAQCGNQVSSDLMPTHAAQHSYSQVYTSTQSYISGVVDEIRGFIKMIGLPRFPSSDLADMRLIADSHFERATDLASVLWQNGLLGYIDDHGAERYYSVGDTEDFHVPKDVTEYVFHACLVESIGIAAVRRRR